MNITICIKYLFSWQHFLRTVINLIFRSKNMLLLLLEQLSKIKWFCTPYYLSIKLFIISNEYNYISLNQFPCAYLLISFFSVVIQIFCCFQYKYYLSGIKIWIGIKNTKYAVEKHKSFEAWHLKVVLSLLLLYVLSSEYNRDRSVCCVDGYAT